MSVAFFFNGPPRVGKDTAQQSLMGHLAALGYSPVPMWFARELKDMTHRLYGLDHLPFDAFESLKDTPQPMFRGLTTRQAYIAVSERLMKPIHGEDVFGQMAATRVKMIEAANRGKDGEENAFVFADCGFSHELNPVINHIGADCCVLIRLIWSGKDVRDFSKDSRSYVYRNDVSNIEIVNVQGSPEVMMVSLEKLALSFAEKPIGPRRTTIKDSIGWVIPRSCGVDQGLSNFMDPV